MMGYSYKVGDVFRVFIPNIHEGDIITKHMLVHDIDSRYLLLCELDHFHEAKGRDNLIWIKKKGKSLILHDKLHDHGNAKISSLDNFKNQIDRVKSCKSVQQIGLNNYFEDLFCDPEIHPTNVHFHMLDVVLMKMKNPYDPIADKNFRRKMDSDAFRSVQKNAAKVFVERNYIFRLTDTYEQMNAADKKLVESYLLDRYTLGLKLKNFTGDEYHLSHDQDSPRTTSTIMNMKKRALVIAENAKQTGDEELYRLMLNWSKFVRKHEVYNIIKEYAIEF
jgi:hypothetical protein